MIFVCSRKKLLSPKLPTFYVSLLHWRNLGLFEVRIFFLCYMFIGGRKEFGIWKFEGFGGSKNSRERSCWRSWQSVVNYGGVGKGVTASKKKAWRLNSLRFGFPHGPGRNKLVNPANGATNIFHHLLTMYGYSVWIPFDLSRQILSLS